MDFLGLQIIIVLYMDRWRNGYSKQVRMRSQYYMHAVHSTRALKKNTPEYQKGTPGSLLSRAWGGGFMAHIA